MNEEPTARNRDARASDEPPRRRRRFYRRPAPGSSPGVMAVDSGQPFPLVRVIAYGPDQVEEQTLAAPDRIRDFLGRWPVTWVNVDGLGDAATLGAIAEIFGLHQLAVEDVVRLNQRAKVEEFGDALFVVLRMPDVPESVETEQFSLFIGKAFVLTFQERQGDDFERVRDRIRKGVGRIRGAGPDYLAYALIDAAVDSYFAVLERFDTRLDGLEQRILDGGDEGEVISEIQGVRTGLMALRRAVWPTREVLAALSRDELPFVHGETRIFLRDCHDHAIEVMDMIESLREVAAGLADMYMSSVGRRTNEIMKVLTLITTLFIPLSFIAAVYGMNFDPGASPWNMPELRWAFGYPAVLAVMTLAALAQILFFRRKGWIGRPRRRER